MRFLRALIVSLVFVAIMGLEQARASSGWFAEVLPSKEPKEFIAGIHWADSEVPIETIPKGNDFESMIELKFKFKQEDWNLLKDHEVLQPIDLEGGVFSFKLLLTGEVTPVDIIAVGPYGEVELQKAFVRVPDWTGFRQNGDKSPPNRSFIFSSLGPSYLAYKETNLADFTMIFTTLKFAYQYLIVPPQWELAANFFANLIPLKKSGLSQSVSFLGTNLRIGYVLPYVQDPARLSLMVGVYYSRMLGTGGAFGFQDLILPQIYPTYRIKTRTGNAYSVYLKYVPLGLNFAEHEIAVGGGWEFPVRGGHPASINVDFSDLRLNISSVQHVLLQSASLSVGYGW
jgi:hypothetical protein